MNREPVAIAAAVRAILLALGAFGFQLTAEQLAAVMLAVEAVLALTVRSTVTSPATLAAQYVRRDRRRRNTPPDPGPSRRADS